MVKYFQNPTILKFSTEKCLTQVTNKPLFFFFKLGFYSPPKNISHISNRFIKECMSVDVSPVNYSDSDSDSSKVGEKRSTCTWARGYKAFFHAQLS